MGIALRLEGIVFWFDGISPVVETVVDFFDLAGAVEALWGARTVWGE